MTRALVRTARERIAECRRVEAKFTAAQAERDQAAADRNSGATRGHQSPAPHAVVTAETERMVWQRVLELLGAKQPPRPAADNPRHEPTDQG